MIRKQIYLKRHQAKDLREKAKVLEVSEAELIRQIIGRYLDDSEVSINRPDPTDWEEIETFLSRQTDQFIAGDPYRFNREDTY